MTLSMSDDESMKSSKKAPCRRRRRATIDTPASSCMAQLNRPKPNKPRRRASVEFSELSEVCVVEPSSYKRWYNGEDQMRFKMERTVDVVSIREMSKQKNNAAMAYSAEERESSCPIGLEQLLSSRGMMATISTRKIVIKSVLLEQTRQRTFGLRDPHQIASVSERLSAEAFEGAQSRGKFQEMAKHVP